MDKANVVSIHIFHRQKNRAIRESGGRCGDDFTFWEDMALSRKVSNIQSHNFPSYYVMKHPAPTQICFVAVKSVENPR